MALTLVENLVRATRVILTQTDQPAVEAKLLADAYARMPLNMTMTASTAVIFGVLTWQFYPQRLVGFWVGTILLNVLLCYGLWAAFTRAARSAFVFQTWQNWYIIQSFSAGAAWALGPCLLMPHATGADLALLICIVLAVCGVAMITLTEQRAGMVAFLVAALLAPSIAAFQIGGRPEQLLALALFGSMVSLIVVGLNTHHTIRTLQVTQSDLLATVALAQEARQHAEAASVAKGQFLANMSHEIRTPMNAILGMLTLTLKTNLSSQQLDYTTKAEAAAKSLLGLINDVLDFSKIEAHKMVLDPSPFRLDQLIRDLEAVLTANLAEKPIELHFDLDPRAPNSLIGDALRLRQVLINLMGNAIKFTHQGHVRLAIGVLAQTGEQVRLGFSVQDSGIGISPENQQRIFEGFSQAEASTTRRFGGSGLGLAISREMVNLMGGRLELESTLGRGSTFSFALELPLATQATQTVAPAESAQRDSPPGPSRDPAPTASGLHGMRLLVVEDNMVNQQVARELLTSEGARVELADNGQSCVSLLERNPRAFDAVLMDLQMPVMDGYMATRAIRHDLGLLELPIIAMTANAMANDRAACLAAGMNDHVGKPFDLRHLVAVLQSQVNQAGQRPTDSTDDG